MPDLIGKVVALTYTYAHGEQKDHTIHVKNIHFIVVPHDGGSALRVKAPRSMGRVVKLDDAKMLVGEKVSMTYLFQFKGNACFVDNLNGLEFKHKLSIAQWRREARPLTD